MNQSAILSMEQSRRTAAAVCACIAGQTYATGLIALAVLAELGAPRDGSARAPDHPLLQSVRITAEGLYWHRAVQEEFPATDRTTEAVLPHLNALRSLPFEADPLEGGADDPTAPVPRPRRGDILFDIIRVKEWSELRNWGSSRVWWLARGGQWAYWNMNETGRVLLCRIAAASLSHADPVTVVFTMKLGRALGFGAVYPVNGKSLQLSVAEALDAVGELPGPTGRDRKWTVSAHARFNQALDSLRDAGVLSDVVWPFGYGASAVGDGCKTLEGWTDACFRFAPARIPTPSPIWSDAPHREVYEF